MMRRLLFFLGLILASLAEAQEIPEPAREFRGAWVASVFNLHWPSRPGLPMAAQQKELRALLDRAVELRLNAIVLQVRPSCDALYASRLEPWSAFLSGKMGVSPGYDPLSFAIAEAHARGLELHAWFNPFRALTTSSGTGASATHVTQTHPEWIRKYGGQSYLDPGDPGARAHVLAVMLDVVRRYDLDGLHIDDYFYPYPVKDKAGQVLPFADDATYRTYGGQAPRDEWRRGNINEFVETLYRSIKKEKRWVKFGISPFGIWRPRVPESIEARLDAYAQLYGDSRRWLQEGWCDYFSPQLYWSIEPAAQSFPVLLEWWRAQNRQGRHLWPGIADDRIGAGRPATEITRQIALTRGGAKYPGVVHWEIKSLMNNRGGIGDLLRSGPYAQSALVPACPWLAAEAGAMAALRLRREGDRVTWKFEGGAAQADSIRWWAVQIKRGGVWSLSIRPAEAASYPLTPEMQAVAVRAIDRSGTAGAAAFLVTP